MKQTATKTLSLLLTLAILFTLNLTLQPAPVQAISPVTTAAEVLWQKTYGGTQDDRAFGSTPIDEGFLVVGSTKSHVEGTLEGWALRLDADGNPVWNQTYLEGDGTELRCAVALTDGFLLVGNTYLGTDINGYVARVDREGNLQWHTQIGGDKIDKLFCGVADSDGYIVTGLSYSYGNGESDVWAVKFDLEGNMVWHETYPQQLDSAGRSIVCTPDGAVLVAGYVTADVNGNCAFLLQKIDANGTLTWTKTYGVSDESQKAYTLNLVSGGYVLAGDVSFSDGSTDACVVKVDFEGNQIWRQTIGGADYDSAAYVTTANGGGILVAGFTFSYGAGQRDFWLFKLDDQGSILFSVTQGDDEFQEAYSVIQTGADQYILAGWTDPPGHPELTGKATYDFSIVKLRVPPTSSNPAGIPSFVYFAVAFVALTVCLGVLLKVRANKRIKIKTNNKNRVSFGLVWQTAFAAC